MVEPKTGLRLGPGSVLVMAHPDDEALWASSLLAGVGRLILVYEALPGRPDITEGRRAALERFPRPVESLRLAETGAFDAAAWPEPVETPEGLAVAAGPGTMPGFDPAAYRAGFATLRDRLRPALAGARSVITHAPWGEYGHEDHVQVFRAVRALQAELGFNLWFSGYCGSRAVKLMLDYLDRNHLMHITRATNVALAGSIAGLYQQHNCWTWDDDYSWFERESFFREQKDGMRSDAMCPMSLPLNLLCTKFANGLHRKTGGFSRFIRPFGRIASRLGVRQLMSL